MRFSRSRGEESGAVALIVAVVVVVLVAAAGFAVDIGMQRVARSDMQSTADVVALDMARALGRGIQPGTAAWQQAIKDSVNANPSTVGRVPDAAPVEEVAGHSVRIVRSGDSGLFLQADPGYLDADRQFTTTGQGAYRAVRVTASTAVEHAFMGGAGSATRSAVAIPESTACVKVGTSAATLSSQQSALLKALLGDLLGSNLDVGVLDGLAGIAGADLDLLDLLQVLAAEVGVGGYQQLVGTEVGLLQLLDATVEAVGQGSTVGVALSALRTRIAALGVTLPGIDVLGLLGIEAGDTVGLGATVNLFDLLNAGLQIANGEHAVALAISGTNILQTLGLGSALDVTTHVSEVPQGTCGPVGTKVSTAQARVKVEGAVAVGKDYVNCVLSPSKWQTNPIGCLLNGLQSIVGSILSVTIAPSIDVELASAGATISDIRCDAGNRPTSVHLTNGDGNGQTSSGLLPLDIAVPITMGVLGGSVTLTLHVSTKPPTGPNATVVQNLASNVYQLLGLTNPNNATTVGFTLPGEYDVLKQGPSNNLSLQNLNVWLTTTQASNGTLLGSIVSQLLGGLFSIVAGVANPLVKWVVQPLLQWVVGPLLGVVTNYVLGPILGTSLANSTYSTRPPTTCRASLIK